MNIQINDTNYHIARLDKKDTDYIKNIIAKTIKKYPELDEYIRKVFKNNDITLKNISDNELIIDIFAAFLHSLKDNENIKQEDQLLKIVKGYVRNYLEAIFTNRKIFIGSHPVQYEPKVVALIAFSNYVNRELSNEFDQEYANTEDSFEKFFGWEIINLFRVLKSSILLFTIGDDVHAIGLCRGFMEIYSKVLLAPRFKDDYFKFKQYNLYLQKNKISHEPLPQEMIKDLGIYCKNENYIAYGWVKNNKGERIKTLTELLEASINIPTIKEFLHYSSEFVHEDYVGVLYDFITLRKSLLYMYFVLINAIYEGDEDIFKNKKIGNLLNNAI